MELIWVGFCAKVGFSLERGAYLAFPLERGSDLGELEAKIAFSHKRGAGFLQGFVPK